MFQSLSDHLSGAIKKLKGQHRITEINVASAIKDIRRALVRADVNYKIAKQVTDSIKQKALGQQVHIAVSPGQLLTKIVQDELTVLMGSTASQLNLSQKPAVILLAGLQGSGKTTLAGKLASHLKSQGQQILLVGCDVHRPAAREQLRVLATQAGVAYYTDETSQNVLYIAQQALAYAKQEGKSTLIFDTAGRQAIDEALMRELTTLKHELKPAETLFVVDAMTGQDAVQTAQAFHARINFDGVVLTKLDGDTRGGAALSLRAVVDKPIKFISTGEKLTNLAVFHPDRMASRILGMGDVISVVERAQQSYDEAEERRIKKKLHKKSFDFNDLQRQIQQMRKLGSTKELLSMLPGMGSVVKQTNMAENPFRDFEIMIASMTPYERQSPNSLDASRRTRIARGSGLPLTRVNQQLKQFDQMRKLLTKANRGGLKQALGSMLPRP